MQRGKLTEGAAGEVVQDADKTGLRFVVCGQAPQIRAGKCRHGHANFHAKRAAEDRFARLSKANITEMNTLGPTAERTDERAFQQGTRRGVHGLLKCKNSRVQA